MFLRRVWKRLWLMLFPLLMIEAPRIRAQGPPFQTDDPVPVELHHYEFYIFGSMDGTPAEIDSTGPAFEFNWGAIPRVQLHMMSRGVPSSGGYDHFKHHCGEPFLFCYGHSVAGQTEQYAYIGMYWTWGKDKKKPDSTDPSLPGLTNRTGF